MQFLVFAGLGVLILYFLYQGQSESLQQDCLANGIPTEECSLSKKILQDFKTIHLGWMLLVLFLFMLSNIFRSLRWMMMIRKLGGEANAIKGFMSIMIGYFVNLGIPRSGELARATVYSKNTSNNTIEGLLGTVISERVVDVIMLGLVVLLATVFEFDLFYKTIESSLNTFNIGMSVTRLALVVLGIVGAVFLIAKILPEKTKQWIVSKLENLKSGVLVIFSLERWGVYVLYTLGIWLCYFLMTYLAFFAFDPTAHLSPSSGLITFLFGTLGMVFPAPGGIGSYQFGIMKALEMYGVSSIDALSFGNIQFFFIQIFGNILFGIASLIGLPLMSKED